MTSEPAEREVSLGSRAWNLVKTHRIRLMVYPAVSVLAVWIGYLALVAGFHSQRTLDGNYDVAVVFFGGFDRRDVPNAESRTRLRLAMDYCSAGFCRDLLIVGGSRRRLDISGAESLAAIALQNGHPKERIAVGKTSYDSVTNLGEVRELAKERGWTRLLLVSSPLHVVRLAWLAGAESQFIFHFQSENLNAYCRRRGLFSRSVHEWLGYLSVLVLPDRQRDGWVARLRG